MSDVMQIAAIGMLQGSRRLETISLNAASATLPGYRRQLLVSEFPAALTGAVVGDRAETAAQPVALMRSLQRAVDLKPGQIVATHRSLDVAVETEGAFFALTDGERTWLTRAGGFRLDESGVLLGERGLRVVGTQGDIYLPGSDVEVQPDGRITREGVLVATLQLFRPEHRQSLRPAEGALLAADEMIPVAADEVQVRGGAVEASNTDATREMLDVMTLARQFESLGRLAQGYDEALGLAIRKLAEL